MEIGSFLKSAVVIDNVPLSINKGKRLHESRIQRIRKTTLCIPLHVTIFIIPVSADPNTTSLFPTLTTSSNITWAMI